MRKPAAGQLPSVESCGLLSRVSEQIQEWCRAAILHVFVTCTSLTAPYAHSWRSSLAGTRRTARSPERNLKEQGFGVRCKRDGNDKPVRSHNGPCYVELDLRDLKSAPPAPRPPASDPVSGLLETCSLQ